MRHIKRSLRGVMNGPVSASMRDKGLAYKVIFGVELPRLQQMAGKEARHPLRAVCHRRIMQIVSFVSVCVVTFDDVDVFVGGFHIKVYLLEPDT